MSCFRLSLKLIQLNSRFFDSLLFGDCKMKSILCKKTIDAHTVATITQSCFCSTGWRVAKSIKDVKSSTFRKKFPTQKTEFFDEPKNLKWLLIINKLRFRWWTKIKPHYVPFLSTNSVHDWFFFWIMFFCFKLLLSFSSLKKFKIIIFRLPIFE